MVWSAGLAEPALVLQVPPPVQRLDTVEAVDLEAGAGNEQDLRKTYVVVAAVLLDLTELPVELVATGMEEHVNNCSVDELPLGIGELEAADGSVEE